jgi:hypothetical protein
MEGAFCICRVHGIVHEASEEGRRGWGGEAYTADVVRDAGGVNLHSGAAARSSAINCR